MALNHNIINLWETKLDNLNITTEKQSAGILPAFASQLIADYTLAEIMKIIHYAFDLCVKLTDGSNIIPYEWIDGDEKVYKIIVDVRHTAWIEIEPHMVY